VRDEAGSASERLIDVGAETEKTRRTPPLVGDPDGPKLGVLTPEQVDEAMFG
jgi:hypothetical protein